MGAVEDKEVSLSYMHRVLLTIDLEDASQLYPYSPALAGEMWPGYLSDIDAGSRRLLDALDECGAKATFFVVGWIATVHPQLVKEVHRRGHEVAAHGYLHEPLYSAERSSCGADARKVKQFLEDLTGRPVAGFRAPGCSVTRRTLWALDELAGAGYLYDSSIYPARRWSSGIASWPRTPEVVATPSGRILEIPLPPASRPSWSKRQGDHRHVVLQSWQFSDGTAGALQMLAGFEAGRICDVFAPVLTSLADLKPGVDLREAAEAPQSAGRGWERLYGPGEWS